MAQNIFPVERPSENGYWLVRIKGNDNLMLARVVLGVSGTFTMTITGEGSQECFDGTKAVMAQWFGPRIEPPETPTELRKALGDDVPRRFRWRNDREGSSGIGICTPSRDHFVLLHSDGTPAVTYNAASMRGYVEITEWIDPDPVKTKDAWDKVLDPINDYVQRKDQNREAFVSKLDIAMLRLYHLGPTLREKVPLE